MPVPPDPPEGMCEWDFNSVAAHTSPYCADSIYKLHQKHQMATPVSF